MPGMYQGGEYDLAGFAVGSVKKADFIDGSSIAEGDAVLGLPSSGVHANGFSLVRKILQASRTASSLARTAASWLPHRPAQGLGLTHNAMRSPQGSRCRCCWC